MVFFGEPGRDGKRGPHTNLWNQAKKKTGLETSAFTTYAYRDEAMIRTIAERVEAFYEELERRMAMVMAA
ncbi:hypothetical protein [Halomonas kalidii]|uniref:Uncharacterized protein n=1 Tax=Halomonas kalidii TaxID=3043293 RepID=A0ABT6VI28_9GAMM|nr:hypothetical protein [Halomonas kalidii]MDI5933626.1 hypothetical protein [Halomonas kalidii]